MLWVGAKAGCARATERFNDGVVVRAIKISKKIVLNGGVKGHSLGGKANVHMSGGWFSTFPTLALPFGIGDIFSMGGGGGGLKSLVSKCTWTTSFGAPLTMIS